MIECSTQEAIASTMFNCYSSNELYRQTQSAKSSPKDKAQFVSSKKKQKISLKKTGSLKNLFVNPKLVPQKPNVRPIEPRQQYFQTIPKKIQTKQKQILKKQNRAYSNLNKQQIVRIFYLNKIYVKVENQMPNKIQNIQTVLSSKNIQSSQLSRAQTLHSFRSFQNFYQENFEKTQQNKNPIKSKVPERSSMCQLAADKKYSILSKPTLESLNPRDTESHCDTQQVFQDEFSEVISSYFPIKNLKIEKQNI